MQANGSVGATAVWQTKATWVTKTVTGLTASTTYTFALIAGKVTFGSVRRRRAISVIAAESGDSPAAE